MKLFALFFAAVLSVQGASDVRLFWWQEVRDEKTKEKIFGCYIAPAAVKAFYDEMAKGDEKAAAALAEKLPKDAWSYVLFLQGEAQSYPIEKIVLREGTICGDFPKLDSGVVDVDRKASTVRVALKVTLEGKLVDFAGNGVYDLKQAAKK